MGYSEVIIDGRLMRVFEILPVIRVEDSKVFLNDDRRRRSYEMKCMARQNYRKK